MKWGVLLATGAALATVGAKVAQATCGDALCRVESGGYAIALPDSVDAPGAFVYLHGYAASTMGAAGYAPLRDPVLARGMAFVAPEGQVDDLQGSSLNWSAGDGYPLSRNELDYLARVITDAVGRFGLDEEKILVAGYSRGGSMAWDLACARPELASAYATYVGGFWEPMNETCEGPVNLYHAHGFADRTVPIEGQRIVWYGQPFELGEVQKALAVWRRTMDCSGKANAVDTIGANWVKRWTDCTGGSITYTHGPGGHGRPKTWMTEVLDWFDELP